jgi:hypothetical protein
MDLDRTLAFTAVLDLHPRGRSMTDAEAQPIRAALAEAMSEANPLDRWAFARIWLADRLATEAIAEADAAGAPYVVPARTRIDYPLALAIARSQHPARVLAITNVYRYGRFTEHDGVVDVHMMGSHIARFTRDGVRLWSCGYKTVTTAEALSNLVTGGYFYHDKRVLVFSSYQTTGRCRTGSPATDGALYPYV